MMPREGAELYRGTFTAAEQQALARAADAPPLGPEAELLRVLIMREQGREQSDPERVARLVDRLTRVVRVQMVGAKASGRDPRLDELFDWLAEIGAERQRAAVAAAEHQRLALAPPVEPGR